MASPAVAALVFGLAALAAVEAVVQPIAETACSTEMKEWLNSLRIESEGLDNQLWGAVMKGKSPRETLNDLLTNVTAQTNNILSVYSALNKSSAAGCSPNFVDEHQVKASESNIHTTYLSKLKELYTVQQTNIAAVNKFLASKDIGDMVELD